MDQSGLYMELVTNIKKVKAEPPVAPKLASTASFLPLLRMINTSFIFIEH
jgi:hypothetical protein